MQQTSLVCLWGAGQLHKPSLIWEKGKLTWSILAVTTLRYRQDLVKSNGLSLIRLFLSHVRV